MTPTTASTDQSLKTKDYPIGALIFAEYNPRQLTKDQYKGLRESIERFGLVDPIIVNKHKDRKNIVVGGHQRIRIAQDLGFKKIPCVEVELNPDQEKELNIRLNKNVGEWDYDALANNFDVGELTEWGFTDDELQFVSDEPINEAVETLAERFIVPPFSVLDTRQGYWQERKRHWKSLIGDNGESRENTLGSTAGQKNVYNKHVNNGVSILDPVLAEITNKWFGLPECKTFDCFAGDSVFGYVSDYVGNEFTGIELRQEQADLNNKRLSGSKSSYICDDGQNVLEHIAEDSQDLLFSCPPYFDLEVYSELENDASNQKEYSDFLTILDNAFSDSIKCLKNNRFAVITVGDIRDKKGFYRGFTDDIKAIFKKSGVLLYNELVLIEPIGLNAMHANKPMEYRKQLKVHQNVLVFYKGDPTQIKENYRELRFES
jgi:hypothetical protein